MDISNLEIALLRFFEGGNYVVRIWVSEPFSTWLADGRVTKEQIVNVYQALRVLGMLEANEFLRMGRAAAYRTTPKGINRIKELK